MSIRSGGIIHLNQNCTQVEDKDILAFQLMGLALDEKIGLLLGGNATYAISLTHDVKLTNRLLLFDIIDSPLDNNAECLFIGDNVKVFIGESRIDIGESLNSRMARIQHLINDMLLTDYVNSIELFLNVELGDDYKIIETCSLNLKDKIILLYNQLDNWTPIVKFIIHK